MSTDHGVDLFLSRFAEGEWIGVVRPWLEACSGNLGRSLVVAPTRGHIHALKRRCLAERVPLLGVEFLTPGSARRKRGGAVGPDRNLQILVLRALVDKRLSGLEPGDEARLVWKSILSDLEAALSDFEELLQAGFGAGDFPRRELKDLFGDFTSWMEGHGIPLAAVADAKACLGPVEDGAMPVADRLLLLAGGPEQRGEFNNLWAMVRGCRRSTVVIALPEFEGARAAGDSGEGWVGMWEASLGIDAEVIDEEEPARSCAALSDLWAGKPAEGTRARVLVGHSRSDEMEKVADEIGSLLASGADNVGVVFPKADAAHAQLARLLGARQVAFTDLLGAAGAAAEAIQVQRLLADFYAEGCRLEELLQLWPLLGALGLAKISQERARGVCNRLFDATQSHGIERHLAELTASERDDDREVGRVAGMLLPSWPGSLTLSDALSRFEAARDRLSAGEPTGWSALRRFAERTAEPMPAAAILEAIKAFLPEKAPVASARQRGGFSAVTLTTVRRAAGVAWSHVILCESNQGVWPNRHEPSCWLGDDTRKSLNESAGLALGLSTADASAANERRLYAAVARDTAGEVIFSAALFDEDDAEAGLGPNPWLERVLWNAGLLAKEDSSVALRRLAGPGRPTRVATEGEPAALEAWGRVWFGRRDPRLAFDEYFFSLGGAGPKPKLSASLVEKGLEDPVRLWFGAILRVERVEWRPYTRARPKLVGTAVHGVLKRALQGLPAEGDFFAMPSRAEAESRLSSGLEALRLKWPDDRYWDSLHVDVSGAARDLLKQVYGFPMPGFAAAEVRMPEGSALQLGPALRVEVSGRMDLVTADRPSWRGSTVTIIDFKTGADLPVTARRMANSGASLQLGVYLEAARSAGATGSVKMLKPGTKPSGIATGQLDEALARLRRLGEHLSTGIYGALTPDRGDFETRFDWPLACAPIGHALLQEKYALTFTGGDDDGGGDPGDE